MTKKIHDTSNPARKIDIKKIAKGLGASVVVPVEKLLGKLTGIVNDKELPVSVRDAAQRELLKFSRRPPF
ncbi:MAG: hypothetical protein Q7S36_01535 [Candidatus Liptonbacteria bacterium]|nr:hypothetical protein [Candidatus Liptonbacteria bacterium]